MASVVDIMERDVAVLRSSASVPEALSVMRKNGVGIVPVVEDGRLVGLMRSELAVDPENAESTVGEVMAGPETFVEKNMGLENAARFMVISRMARLPVVDNGVNRRFMGMVTATAIVNELKK